MLEAIASDNPYQPKPHRAALKEQSAERRAANAEIVCADLTIRPAHSSPYKGTKKVAARICRLSRKKFAKAVNRFHAEMVMDAQLSARIVTDTLYHAPALCEKALSGQNGGGAFDPVEYIEKHQV